MRQRPKYTRVKEEGRQRPGSLISTFLMRCRSRRLVLAASGDDLFHQFHVLMSHPDFQATFGFPGNFKPSFAHGADTFPLRTMSLLERSSGLQDAYTKTCSNSAKVFTTT